MSDFLSRFRVLPLLVLVAMISFVVRLGEAYTGVRSIAASAIAAEAEAEKKHEADGADSHKAAEKPADDDTMAVKLPADKNGDTPMPSTGKDVPVEGLPETWADPAQQDMADSPAQVQFMDDLAKRREQLQAREKALNTREAMMKAAEKQIDEKVDELSQLKKQLEQLLGQQDVEENNRIQSLVKIYEGMKPKDAAAIFNQMDMPVLLKVVSRMSERKASPVIAAMDTAKAKELTVQLTEMKKLPEQKDNAESGGVPGPVPTPAPAGSAPLPGLDALGQ